MKKLLVLAAAVLMSAGIASAQNYNYGVGLRLGLSPSIDFKWNHAPANSWEFNLNLPDVTTEGSSGFSASAAYEWNWPIGNQGYDGEGFNAYAGPQATIGIFSKAFMVGVGGMGGIEYKFDIPLALAIDWKPTLSFITAGNHRGIGTWGFYDLSIAVRYAF
jgi:hypothetical protein